MSWSKNTENNEIKLHDHNYCMANVVGEAAPTDFCDGKDIKNIIHFVIIQAKF